MRNKYACLAWEYGRENWISMTLAVTGAAAFFGLIFFGTRNYLSGRDVQDTFARLFFVELFCYLAVLQVARRGELPSRFYRLPVSTAALAVWQMSLGIMAMDLMLLASAGAKWGLTGVLPPLAGPLLVGAAAMALTQAILWGTPGRPWLRLPILVYALWLLVHWLPETNYGAGRSWLELSGLDILNLLGIIGLAYLVAYWGIRRARRGDGLEWPTRLGWSMRWASWPFCKTTLRQPFASSRTAQFWFEWRQKGIYMPGLAACFLGVFFVSWLVGWMDTHDIVEAVATTSIALPCWGAFFLGVVLGRTGNSLADKQDIPGISIFRATQPVTDGEVAAGIIRVGLASLLATAGVYVLCCGLMVAAIHIAGQQAEMTQTLHQYFHTARQLSDNVLGIMLVSWTVLGLSASIAMTGRQGLFIAVAVAIAAVVFACGLFFVFLLPYLTHLKTVKPDLINPLLKVIVFIGVCLPAAIGLGCLGGTAWAYLAAARRRLLGGWWPIAVLLSWLLTMGWVGYTWCHKGEYKIGEMILVAGLATLIFAPPATARLAIYWNRHR